MPLVVPVDSDIRPQDLTLDFYLEATPIGGGKKDFSGKNTYIIQAFTENLGFGITSLDIDIKPNLQPVVNITFKDLYGNLVYSRDERFKFDILFQLPYPKFNLYIKGYVGKPVNFLLQVKSVKTTYQSSDGSYEIKAEFIPNVFGFFGDIPYQYLFAVAKLKDKFGENTEGSEGNSSIIEIAKNGIEIKQKIQQVEDKYKLQRDTLTILAGDPTSIATSYNQGTLKFDSISPDESLTSAGFTGVTFNINTKDPKGKDYTIIDSSLEVIGNSILASINSPTTVEFKSTISSLSAFTQSDKGKKQIEDAKTIITSNLNAITKASSAQGYSSVEDILIDTQTIYNVMTRLAGDCAYILGYILEGGISGYNADTSRPTNNEIFGNYYPLIEENNLGQTSAFGEQKPWSQAPIELKKVEDFCQALYEGVQQAETIIQEASDQNNAITDQPAIEGEKIAKRLTNAEHVKNNPYLGQSVDKIITNLIQRAGLASCGYAFNTLAVAQTNLTDAEYENFSDAVLKLKGTDRTTLKTFAEEVKQIFNSKGELTKEFTDKTKNNPNLTYQDYFASYFEKMDLASTNKEIFLNSDPKSLVCVSMFQNGVMYHNPKDVLAKLTSKAAGANSCLNKGGKAEIVAYIRNKNAPLDVDQLNGDPSSDTQMPQKVKNPNFQFFKVEYNPPTEAKYGVFINYAEMVNAPTPTYKSLDSLILPVITGQTISGYEQAQKEDYLVRLVSQTQLSSPADYVTSLKNETVRSNLWFYCSKILNLTSGTEEEQEKRLKDKQEAENKDAVSRGETPTEIVTVGAVEPYSRDDGQINAVYTQFHHICQAWISLATTENSDALPDGTDVNLRTVLEKKYRSTDGTSAFYLNFNYPLVIDNPAVDIRDAIINTDPLLENNTSTSTLNMMQNICQLNNFLLQPIPAGFTSDLKDLFKPQPNIDYSNAVGRNALSIIWAPTPENRLTKNDNSPIYPDKNFLKTLDNLKTDIIAFQFGSPNNVFLKSVKAGTDDNKVTSESLQATSDIVNNQNQNKKKGFDCSMLAVMQGRSYKISLDILGNAQIFPTMNLAIDGLPIFTGLYWVLEVQHKLTPNNMETEISAMKMKIGNGGNFALIMPITKRSVRTVTPFGGGGDGGSGGGNFGEGLNTELLKKLKDVKLRNPAEINAVIKTYTSNKYTDFVTWVNAEVVGKASMYNRGKVDSANWNKCWETIIPVTWSEYGTGGINFLEFVCLFCIIYGETGGKFSSVREGMNSLDNGTNPGIAYAYKYNRDYNKTSGDLFSDANFISAHANKPLGNDKNTKNSNDPSWKGTSFPKSLFPSNIKEAARTTPATFINESDFYKFSGRGLIQTTWRSNYEKILTWVLSYTGNDTIVKKYKGIWQAAPYNGNKEIILTRSTNADWDELFSSQILLGQAINIHSGKNRYQYMPALDSSKEELIKAINKVGLTINGAAGIDGEYVSSYRTRVYGLLNALYPQGAPQISSTNTDISASNDGDRINQGTSNECTVVTRGKNKIAIHTGKERQFKKREVRSITLHITDGWGYTGCAQRTCDGVGACDKEFNQGGIHYAVDWTGARVTGIPEDIRSVHGNNWNAHGIGIEICAHFGVKSKGPAGPEQRVVYSNDAVAPVGKASYGGTPNPGYCTLDYKYCGYSEFMEFTDAQITATYNLCTEILGRYPKMKAAIQGKNPYYVWGWNSKPAAGSNVKANKIEYTEFGIFAHAASKGASHVDPPPTPKLIAMLKKLGMTG